MTTLHNTNSDKPVLYLLSKHEYNEHKFDKLIDSGYWEYHEDQVKTKRDQKFYRRKLQEFQIGDRVAIYNYFRQTHDDFEQEHNYQIKKTAVSYILIKAVGKIIHPCEDGKTIKFDCQKVNNFRRWYHHTTTAQVWQVVPEDNVPWRQNLIDFTFNGAGQDPAELKDALTK